MMDIKYAYIVLYFGDTRLVIWMIDPAYRMR